MLFLVVIWYHDDPIIYNTFLVFQMGEGLRENLHELFSINDF
jgi:hypothetical protein